eukprot:gene2662-3078_t
MHALLLGLVKKEVTIILDPKNNDDENCLIKDHNKLKSRLKSTVLPSDCGRLPTNILERVTLDSFTAQQWQIFANVYARACFFELLPAKNYRCLVLLCEVVEICSKGLVNKKEVLQLAQKLQQHHILFGELYGKWQMSINNHMSLHLADTINDYRPCHTFWCFAFEWMNGILSGVPTSGRCIEKEYFSKFIQQ